MKKSIKLFCIPFAGGSEYFYSQWSTKFDQNIKVIPILLKGRNTRYNLKYQSFNEMIEDVFAQITEGASSEEEIALFGHSMGGILSYEVSKKLENEGYNVKHIFLSGINHPKDMEPVEEKFIMDDNYLTQRLLDLGGIQDEFLENRELMEYFFKIIKHDFLLIEEYKKADKLLIQLNTPVSIMNGIDDKSIVSEQSTYDSLSYKEIQFHIFSGDHFYLNQHLDELIQLIRKSLIVQ